MAKTVLLGLIGLLTLAVPAWATPVGRIPIPTLFNSGVDGSGKPLADGTVGDPHYALTAVPFPSVSSTVALRSDGPLGATVIGPWAGDDGLSAWISPAPAGGPLSSEVGEYLYTTTFDLTGFDLASVLIYGAWAADDNGAQLVLNGLPIDILTSLDYSTSNFTGLNTFNYYYRDTTGNVAMVENAPLQSGFLPGINTLSFRVDNTGGATGFRVELNASAVPLDSAAIAEPASFVLLGSGLLGLVAARRRVPKARLLSSLFRAAAAPNRHRKAMPIWSEPL